MNGLRGEKAITDYAYWPCIACDCFPEINSGQAVARHTQSALRLAMTRILIASLSCKAISTPMFLRTANRPNTGWHQLNTRQ